VGVDHAIQNITNGNEKQNSELEKENQLNMRGVWTWTPLTYPEHNVDAADLELRQLHPPLLSHPLPWAEWAPC